MKLGQLSLHLELIFKATHISEKHYYYSQQSSECGEQSQINYSNIKKYSNIIRNKQLLTYPSFVHQIEFLLLLILSISRR